MMANAVGGIAQIMDQWLQGRMTAEQRGREQQRQNMLDALQVRQIGSRLQTDASERANALTRLDQGQQGIDRLTANDAYDRDRDATELPRALAASAATFNQGLSLSREARAPFVATQMKAALARPDFASDPAFNNGIRTERILNPVQMPTVQPLDLPRYSPRGLSLPPIDGGVTQPQQLVDPSAPLTLSRQGPRRITSAEAAALPQQEQIDMLARLPGAELTQNADYTTSVDIPTQQEAEANALELGQAKATLTSTNVKNSLSALDLSQKALQASFQTPEYWEQVAEYRLDLDFALSQTQDEIVRQKRRANDLGEDPVLGDRADAMRALLKLDLDLQYKRAMIEVMLNPRTTYHQQIYSPEEMMIKLLNAQTNAVKANASWTNAQTKAGAGTQGGAPTSAQITEFGKAGAHIRDWAASPTPGDDLLADLATFNVTEDQLRQLVMKATTSMLNADQKYWSTALKAGGGVDPTQRSASPLPAPLPAAPPAGSEEDNSMVPPGVAP